MSGWIHSPSKRPALRHVIEQAIPEALNEWALSDLEDALGLYIAAELRPLQDLLDESAQPEAYRMLQLIRLRFWHGDAIANAASTSRPVVDA